MAADGSDAKLLRLPAPLLHSAAGMGSGLVANVVTYPLDFVKVRYIAQDGTNSRGFAGDGVKRFSRFWSAVRKNYTVGGLFPMYRGVGASMIASSSSWAIYFGAYRHYQARLKTRYTGPKLANPDSAGKLGDFLAATGAGVSATFCTCPLWLVKTRLQLQRGAGESVAQYRNTFHGLKYIARTEGIRGLYSGLTPSLMMVSHGSIQMTLYESLKEGFIRTKHAAGTGTGERPRLANMEVTAASLGSKIIASFFTTPLVVLRIRVQDPRNALHGVDVAYSGFFGAFRTILQREGVRGLYRGFVPTLWRTLPNSVVTFLTYEHISATLFKCFGDPPTVAQPDAVKVALPPEDGATRRVAAS
eukprot:TRINITY_DN8203_c0_g1_i2.p1 TRINITY_DN8203_c0_g1~~TRINITY_DN8203_c0_g1_i2.p1  ORF type:complete len:359 (+),score=112.54 TRINITY_DN8203_c0_g1_i2:127-1203(+)